ncbi:hypothetical protein [uncultured Treponema sp.]|uniref:hypothetical protein n=1 Tax=uncultured Treponema sp. TaxID=162155 RepID=UPI0025EC5AEC|nr:hypothetical protein [uncultured Treponema sp.]
MENAKSRVEIYNEDYVGLNHAYVQMYKFYNKLLECSDADEEVLAVMREILLVYNPTLDRIKSEMTIKTRYKEEPASKSAASVAANGTEGTASASSSNKSSSPVILYGNFTGE